MSGTLKSRAVGAVVWTVADQVSTQGVRFVIGVILARLLLPAEFGLLAMLGVFLGVAQVFASCGLGQAIIQRQDTTQVDESSVFYANVFLGFVAALFLFLAAPWIAHFYRQPQLVMLTRIMALDVLITSASVMQTALLTREMDFKTQLKAGVISNFVSGIVAVVMAVRGMGVVSLVAQVLIGDVLRTVLLWKLHPWRPVAEFNMSAFRRLLSFGSRIFASALLNEVFQNLYPLVIGKFFAAASLGFFARARQMQQVTAGNLVGTVNRVSFPLFSALQHDSAGLKRAVRKSLVFVAFLCFPLMVGMACVAQPLIRVLLTDKWLPCVTLVQIFCVSGALYPLHVIHSYTLMALGRADLFFRLEAIKKVLGVTAIALTYRFGVTGLVWGDAGVTVVCCFIYSYYAVQMISYSWREQVRDMIPYVSLSAAMAVPVLSVNLLGIRSVTARLVIQIAAGVTVYAAGSFLFRLAAFEDIRGFVQRRVWSFANPPAVDS